MVRSGYTALIARAIAFGLYLVGTGVAPLADAKLDAEARSQVAHVESASNPDCPTGHDHENCGLCLKLRSGATVIPSIALLPVVAPETYSPARAVMATASFLARSTNHSRAPPLS
jgi:hypothetical protein